MKTETLDKRKTSIHKERESLFSSSVRFVDYHGLLNLCIVLLAVSTSKLVLDNLVKYGCLVNFSTIFRLFSVRYLSIFFVCNFFIILTLLLEKVLAFYLYIPNCPFLVLHACNCAMMLIYPAIQILRSEFHPLLAFIVLSSHVTTFFKLISFIVVNYQERKKLLHAKKEGIPMQNEKIKKSKTLEIVYPHNLTLYGIYYFIFAPTLCYELNFPRTQSIRKMFLFRRLVEVIFLGSLLVIIMEQWIIPHLCISQSPFNYSNPILFLNELFTLALPNHVMWILFFYWYFHSFLNVVAEVLRFADRQFYLDWWNSYELYVFWRKWNVPAHNFSKRHIYIPLISRGFSPAFATFVVFFISALAHEYVASISLKLFRLWFFAVMIMQQPIAYLVHKLFHDKEKMGNIFLWISVILGQPLTAMMYIHDYYYYKTHS